MGGLTELGDGSVGLTKNLDKLLGTEGKVFLAPRGRYDRALQVIHLLAVLNRSDIFVDLRGRSSLRRAALDAGMCSFLYQMIVAYELKLRLARPGGIEFHTLTGRAVSAMQAAERWVDGVDVRMPDRTRPHIEMYSRVHNQQVGGLLRFAELMAWPALEETREFVEVAYADMNDGMRFNIHLWDWRSTPCCPGTPVPSPVWPLSWPPPRLLGGSVRPGTLAADSCWRKTVASAFLRAFSKSVMVTVGRWAPTATRRFSRRSANQV